MTKNSVQQPPDIRQHPNFQYFKAFYENKVREIKKKCPPGPTPNPYVPVVKKSPPPSKPVQSPGHPFNQPSKPVQHHGQPSKPGQHPGHPFNQPSERVQHPGHPSHAPSKHVQHPGYAFHRHVKHVHPEGHPFNRHPSRHVYPMVQHKPRHTVKHQHDMRGKPPPLYQIGSAGDLDSEYYASEIVDTTDHRGHEHTVYPSLMDIERQQVITYDPPRTPRDVYLRQTYTHPRVKPDYKFHGMIDQKHYTPRPFMESDIPELNPYALIDDDGSGYEVGKLYAYDPVSF